MRILYRNPENESLSVTNVTNTNYDTEEGILTFFGDEDICIQTDPKTAEELTRILFLEEKLDISKYECSEYEWPDDDDFEDDDDDDDDDGNGFIINSDFFKNL